MTKPFKMRKEAKTSVVVCINIQKSFSESLSFCNNEGVVEVGKNYLTDGGFIQE